MSNISQSRKFKSFWKISDCSKVPSNEPTLNDASKLLPSKFSPHKSRHKDSQIFNSSRENSKMHGRSPSLTSRESQPLSFASSKQLIVRKQSLPMLDSPEIQHHASKDSPSMKESFHLQQAQYDSPLLKSKMHFQLNYQLLKSQQLVSLQAIYQIKHDFTSFKEQIWAELLSQRELINKNTEIIIKKLQQYTPKANFIQQSVVQPLKSLGTVDILAKITMKIDSFEEQLQRKCELAISQRQQAHENAEQEHKEIAQNHITLISENNSLNVIQFIDQTNKTPIEKLNEIDTIPQKRQSPIDRCNHIAQTIGILSEINSSPISNKAKSIEKLNIKQYKQKLMSVCKSNQKLIKQPLRKTPQSQLKGNPKLQKFYNAIEKLKQQVNQIRNINDLNQIKKLTILKVNE